MGDDCCDVCCDAECCDACCNACCDACFSNCDNCWSTCMNDVCNCECSTCYSWYDYYFINRERNSCCTCRDKKKKQKKTKENDKNKNIYEDPYDGKVRDTRLIHIYLESNDVNPWGIHVNFEASPWVVTKVIPGQQGSQKGVQTGWKIICSNYNIIANYNKKNIKTKMTNGIATWITFNDTSITDHNSPLNYTEANLMKCPMSDHVADPWGLELDFERLPWIVSSVQPGQQAARNGIKKGWEVVRVNGLTVCSMNIKRVRKRIINGSSGTITFNTNPTNDIFIGDWHIGDLIRVSTQNVQEWRRGEVTQIAPLAIKVTGWLTELTGTELDNMIIEPVNEPFQVGDAVLCEGKKTNTKYNGQQGTILEQLNDGNWRVEFRNGNCDVRTVHLSKVLLELNDVVTIHGLTSVSGRRNNGRQGTLVKHTYNGRWKVKLSKGRFVIVQEKNLLLKEKGNTEVEAEEETTKPAMTISSGKPAKPMFTVGQIVEVKDHGDYQWSKGRVTRTVNGQMKVKPEYYSSDDSSDLWDEIRSFETEVEAEEETTKPAMTKKENISSGMPAESTTETSKKETTPITITSTRITQEFTETTSPGTEDTISAVEEEEEEVVKTTTKTDLMDIYMSGHYVDPWGLGVDFEKSPWIVSSVDPGQQAARNGIKEGWEVIRVNGITIDAQNIERFRKRIINGSSGTITFNTNPTNDICLRVEEEIFI